MSPADIDITVYERYHRVMDEFRCEQCVNNKWRCADCRRIAHRAAVRRFKDRNRSGRPSGAPKRESVKDEDLIAKYQSGMSTFDIAKTCDLTPTGIVYRLKKQGIVMRPKWSYESFRTSPKRINRGPRNGIWKNLPMAEIIQMYQSGMCCEEIARDIGNITGGTIVYKLRDAGIEVSSSGWGRVHTAKDGHKVSSSLELTVDDWLSDHSLPHCVHPRLPWGTRHRADFLVNESTFIEVWGVINNPSYNARRQQKIDNYRKHDTSLIQVFPSDIANCDQVLSSLLQIKT